MHKTETESELAAQYDLIPILRPEDIIGDNFRMPDKLIPRGFEPKGFQKFWRKEMEIGGSKSEIMIIYSPGLRRPVQYTDIQGEAGRTVTDWYAEILSKTELEPDAFVVSAEKVLQDVVGDLFRITPGKIS